MKVGVFSVTAGLTEMEVDLLGMRYGDLMVVVGVTVVLKELDFALGTVRRERDLEFDREAQRFGRIEIGLLVEPTELDAVNDDRLVVGMEKSALSVRQGPQAEEAHNG
jgi:hypothetical protein